MILQKYLPLFSCVYFIFLIHTTISLTCYKGMSYTRNSKPQETEECSKRHCYNITADGGLIFKGQRAGCSTLRCFAIGSRCVSTEIKGVPVKFCCCDYDRCN